MKTFIIKVICAERKEYKYTVEAENREEAEENFLIDGEVSDTLLLTSKMEEVLSIEEAKNQ